jgi:hypothetical protein
MDMKIFMKKAGMLIGFCMIIALSASSVSAWRGGGRHGGYYRGYNHGYYGYNGYYGYHGWGFNRPYWGFSIGGFTPSVGAVVAYMPEGYRTYIINGVRYYYCDGYYFRSCPSGYVIVPEPVVSTAGSAEPAAKSPPTTSPSQEPSGTTAQQPEPSGAATQATDTKTSSGANTPTVAAAGAKTTSDDAVTINIPNANGGYTAVKLARFKDGYKGPQGEYYPGHPTVDQLRALYGK